MPPVSTLPLEIRRDDLRSAAVIALLEDHVRSLAAVSPPESCHVLDLAKLRRPEITFWSAWRGADLAGCGALKELSPHHGELKSMRTAATHLRQGVATAVLQHLVSAARQKGYRQLYLETGAMDYFAPARALYARYGFQVCGPFGDYREDPNSVFMTREL